MRPVFFLYFLLISNLAAGASAQFAEHEIATGLKGGYQVAVMDVNNDGKPDLVGLGERMSELLWFENPNWERHVLATGVSRMVNLDACSSDENGFPEIVLAQEFSNRAKNSPGVVSILRSTGDPEQPWSVAEIDRLPTSHRIRCADFDGSGKQVAVNAPLTGAEADFPDFRDNVPLVFYRPGEWKRHLIGDENEGVMHGIYIYDWNGDSRDDILTASFLGIHVYSYSKDGNWQRTEIAKGDPAPWPKSGASDLDVGFVGKRRFIASIEPWHGNQIAVYRDGDRMVIDDSFGQAHSISVSDLNGDGRDEIVAGDRGKRSSVYIYYAQDEEGNSWSRTVLDDGGISAAACVVADLNQDEKPDIACIGSMTANLKWYENLGSK